MKRIAFFLTVIILIYAACLSYFYFDLFNRNKKINLLFEEADTLKKKLQLDVAGLNTRQDSLQKENEALKKESLDYLKRQKEVNEKQALLEKKLKIQLYALDESSSRLEENSKKLGELKAQNLQLADIHNLAGDVRVKKQQEKIRQLENDLKSNKERLKKQEALLHYNLGVCYSKEKNYEMAIDEYEKVLLLNPDDADTHYNLAILYDDFRKNPRRGLEHYQKFIQLRPEAPEIDEVKEWIERLAPK